MAIAIVRADAADTDAKLRLSRIVDTPDLAQRSNQLPGGGANYCAPVCVSNAMVWLSRQGYTRLAGRSADDQIEVARLLGEARFMATDASRGTGVRQVVEGLRTYVTSRGYSIKNLQYQSWRINKTSPGRMVRHASADSAARLLTGQAVAFLNVGWYDKNGSEYRRLGGHWVTLVGIKRDAEGYTFLIRDPGGSSRPKREAVTARRITTGRLTGDHPMLPLSAEGAWELGGELRIKSGANTSVLDALVVLELE